MKNNTLKDFVSVAGPMNITHFIVFTKTKVSSYMRVLRLPHGPTLTFKISSYSLCKDVVSSLKRPSMEPKQFRYHPLLVMNGFSGEGMHLKLMTTMFQNLFPSINVNKVQISVKVHYGYFHSFRCSFHKRLYLEIYTLHYNNNYVHSTLYWQNSLYSLQVNLSDVRRCVLLNYNDKENVIEFRQ